MRRQAGAYFCVVPRLRSWNPKKNWPVENWQAMIGAFEGPRLAVAVVGGLEELRAFGADPKPPERLTLRRSVDLLTHARFAVASESGGALLSLLCGCPTFVFGHPGSQERITVTENPLKTPVRYLADPEYDFDPKEVADAATEFMRTL